LREAPDTRSFPTESVVVASNRNPQPVTPITGRACDPIVMEPILY
jgi:hypothetical protein